MGGIRAEVACKETVITMGFGPRVATEACGCSGDMVTSVDSVGEGKEEYGVESVGKGKEEYGLTDRKSVMSKGCSNNRTHLLAQ